MVLVLDHPQDVVNIGGVIRVMMNFGISRLRLVNPDEFDAYIRDQIKSARELVKFLGIKPE